MEYLRTLILMVNEGTYTTHGAYGMILIPSLFLVSSSMPPCNPFESEYCFKGPTH